MTAVEIMLKMNWGVRPVRAVGCMLWEVVPYADGKITYAQVRHIRSLAERDPMIAIMKAYEWYLKEVS